MYLKCVGLLKNTETHRMSDFSERERERVEDSVLCEVDQRELGHRNELHEDRGVLVMASSCARVGRLRHRGVLHARRRHARHQQLIIDASAGGWAGDARQGERAALRQGERAAQAGQDP